MAEPPRQAHQVRPSLEDQEQFQKAVDANDLRGTLQIVWETAGPQTIVVDGKEYRVESLQGSRSG